VIGQYLIPEKKNDLSFPILEEYILFFFSGKNKSFFLEVGKKKSHHAPHNLMVNNTRPQ
jgi:hypothetical protein